MSTNTEKARSGGNGTDDLNALVDENVDGATDSSLLAARLYELTEVVAALQAANDTREEQEEEARREALSPRERATETLREEVGIEAANAILDILQETSHSERRSERRRLRQKVLTGVACTASFLPPLLSLLAKRPPKTLKERAIRAITSLLS